MVAENTFTPVNALLFDPVPLLDAMFIQYSLHSVSGRRRQRLQSGAP
jgi:hypothetical protein